MCKFTITRTKSIQIRELYPFRARMFTSLLSPESTSCHALESPDPLTVFLAAFILVGIFVSYLPQHAKIISNATSAGLSPWWVLLGGVSSIAALGNIMTLPASRADMKCCKELTGGECAAALLGVAQIGLQWGCFMFMYVIVPETTTFQGWNHFRNGWLTDIISVMLFLIFFPVTNDEVDLTSSTATLTNSPPPKRRDQVIVGFTTLVVLFVVGITSIALVAAYPHHTQNWANFLGTVAGILAMIQYIPQIYYTWRLGEIRSLSILTMLIQVPGSFLFAFSLWLRVGWEGWSAWLMFLVTGVLQGVLLGLAITYWLARRNEGDEAESADGWDSPSLADDVDGANGSETRATERTRLLRGEGSRGKTTPRSTYSSTRTNDTGNRSLDMLYSATPPEHDSDPTSDPTSDERD